MRLQRVATQPVVTQRTRQPTSKYNQASLVVCTNTVDGVNTSASVPIVHSVKVNSLTADILADIARTAMHLLPSPCTQAADALVSQ